MPCWARYWNHMPRVPGQEFLTWGAWGPPYTWTQAG